MKIKQILAQQELSFPCLFNSLLSAIKPILSINRCQVSIKTLSQYAMKLIEQNPEIYNELVKDIKNENQDALN